MKTPAVESHPLPSEAAGRSDVLRFSQQLIAMLLDVQMRAAT